MERSRYKKGWALVLVAALLWALAGCGTADQPTDMTQQTEDTVMQTQPSSQTDPSDPVTEPTEQTQPPVTEPTEPEPPQILFEYQVLHAINQDLVGWMEIPGTKIDYPVVQSTYEPNFYLRRNFWKTGATCGTLYARERCDVFKPSDNITIYGHKMGNGTMFADLHLYKDIEFWEQNKYIRFDTIYERHTYEIFAVFRSTANLDVGFAYHIFDDALSEVHYDSFVSKCQELALYDTGITPKLGEKLITLSTCDKSIDNGRFVVVARCID